MVNDFSAMDYNASGRSGANSGFVKGRNLSGGTTYVSDHYDRAGTASYTKESLAKANDGAIDHLYKNILDKKITGQELNNIADTADNVLSDPTMSNVKPSVRSKLAQIAAAKYGFGAKGQTEDAGQSAEGSRVLSSAGEGALASIASRIWSALAKELCRTCHKNRGCIYYAQKSGKYN